MGSIVIHPAVAAAEADELISAGYGDIERALIPPDWREKPLAPRCKCCRRNLAMANSPRCAGCAARQARGMERLSERRKQKEGEL